MLRRLFSFSVAILVAALLPSTSSHHRAVATADEPLPDEELKGIAAEKWEAAYGEWKDNIVAMRDLRLRYATASEENLDTQLEELEAEYRELIEKGRNMIPRLRMLSKGAFVEAPNVDRQVTRFLVKLAEDDVARDDYARAFEIAKLLEEYDNPDPDIHQIAAISAFALHDFDAALNYFEKADEAKKLNAEWESKFRRNAVSYKRLWAEEQKIREAEALSDNLPRVLLKTSKGDIVLELFENEAPQTVGNFISLVEKGFYDGLSFHRVISNFMAQGGCPKGDGKGGPGYNIYCECYKGDHRKHFTGSLSMAHSNQRDTGGSQFFITYLPTPNLNGKHTVFGRVIEGMDVVRALTRREPREKKQGVIDRRPPPPDGDTIIEAKVLRKREHAYQPTKVQ
jgi:cyclophilin family peptidyl-prolyl cis-trans isomerase